MQASERERPAKGRGRRRYLLTDKIEYNAAVADAGPIDASIGDGRGRASSANSLHCSIQNFWTVTKQCSRRREALADGVPAQLEEVFAMCYFSIGPDGGREKR